MSFKNARRYPANTYAQNTAGNTSSWTPVTYTTVDTTSSFAPGGCVVDTLMGTSTAVEPTDVTVRILTRCAQSGHVMSDEVALEDGTVTGMCETCGEMIKGRRIAGGMGLQKLRAALEQALDEGIGELAEQFLNLADEIDAEERALHEAKSLLRLAERVLLARR